MENPGLGAVEIIRALPGSHQITASPPLVRTVRRYAVPPRPFGTEVHCGPGAPGAVGLACSSRNAFWVAPEATAPGTTDVLRSRGGGLNNVWMPSHDALATTVVAIVHTRRYAIRSRTTSSCPRGPV